MNYGLQCWWRQLLAFLTAGFFAAVTALVKDGDTINIVLSIPYALTGIYYNDSIGMEVAAEAALRDVMSNPSILPNTKIELIKVNTWDDRYTRPSDAFKYVSGGYASAALYDAITQKNVVGIIGERYSGVTRFAASVASQLEVPFCGPSQTSPAFSDKRNFKYFFRMQPGVGLGNHLSKLLQYFKAANVIIVYSSDNPLSESVRVETEQAFAQNRITISGRFRLTRTMYNTKRFDNIFTSMKTLRTYYIFTILSPGDIDDFYMEASKVGLVGEKYVWFGIAWPLASTLPSSQEKITQSQGFVQLYPLSSSNEGFVRKRYVKQFWAQIARSYPQWYNPAQGPPISRNGQGMYDCMKTILIGIDQYLKENPHLSPGNLSQPEIRSTLNISKFASTGYSGVSSESIELTETGDLILPYVYVSTNKTNMVASFMPGISDGFGFTTLAGSSLIELKKPTFYGGSNTPPPSQPVRQVKWISSKRAFSDTLRFCHAIIGAFMGYTAFRFFLQIMRGLRRNVILHVCLLAGSILLFIPNLEFAEEPSNDKCSEDSYFDFSGLVLIYTSLSHVGFQRFWREKNIYTRSACFDTLGLFAVMCFALALQSLQTWVVVKVTGPLALGSDLTLEECSFMSLKVHKLWFLLYLQCGIPLLAAIYFTVATTVKARLMCFKRLSLFLLTSLAAIVFVGWTFPSDAFKHIFMLSIKLSITLAATVFCHLSIDFDKIENWVPGESDLLSNSIYHSPTLHRKIRFSTRSAFGWSPRKTASAIFYVSNSNFSVQLLETRSSILHIIPLRTAKIALPESTVDDDDLGKAFEHNNGSVIVLTTPQTVYRIHTAHKHQLEALIKLCELSMQTRHLHSIASQQAFSTVDPL